MTKRKTPQPKPISVYLGSDARQRRIDALDAKARALGITRSELIQKIADGELELVPRRQQSA